MPAQTPVVIVPKAVNEELVTPVPREVPESTLFPPTLYDCPNNIFTEEAPNAPDATLNEKKLLTDAPIPDVEDAVFERTG